MLQFELDFQGRRILIDPWFGRFPTGFFTGNFNPDTPLRTNTDLIDQHITTADQILVGHGHWDHMADVATIARKTGAMVLGSETHANVLRATGMVDESKIVIVEGGEVMQFDGYTIEVFPSLHSMGPTKKFAVPGHLISVPEAPTTVGDLPEGDSLIYQITLADGFRIFLQSTANFIERPFSDGPHDLSDVFGQSGSLDFWIGQAKKVSPRSRFVVLDFFESFAP
jgi:hypothetical protein